MSDYKRLTNPQWKEHCDLFKDCYDCEIDCDACELNYMALKRLAELEDKIEDGIIIEFPRMRKRQGFTYPYRVEFVDEDGDVECWVYKTEEEAKAKLKELQCKE